LENNQRNIEKDKKAVAVLGFFSLTGVNYLQYTVMGF